MVKNQGAVIDKRIERVLISEEEIQSAIVDVANWINKNYQDKDLVLVTILKGSIPFVGSLIPKITIDFSIDYLCVSSFKGETCAQSLPEIVTNLSSSLEGKDVLLVEDIVDSGRTIKLVMEALSKQNCNSCKLITLLDKPGGRVVELLPDYSCFKIDNLFVVGFGLDYKEKMRNLPYVGILKKECYTK